MALAARTAAMRRLIHNSSRYAVTGVFFEALYSPNGWLGARIDELDAALARSFGSGGGAELAVHVRRGDKLKERLAGEAITLLSPLEGDRRARQYHCLGPRAAARRRAR